MSPSWSEFLTGEGARLGAHSSVDGVLDFGDAGAERAAAARGGVFADLSPRAVLRIAGAEAAAFLQAQLTCDVEALRPGQSSFGAYCTAKGRVYASFLLHRREEDFLMLLSRDIAGAVQKRLQMYVLRAKVKLEAFDSVVLGLQGAAAIEADRVEISLPGERRICITDEANAQRLWRSAKTILRPVGFACWQWLDIAQGEPWIDARTQEAFVPQMINLERIGAVSFKKGCYPGQEVVARTQYLGKVHRRMHRVHSDRPVEAGQEVYGTAMGDQACGMILHAAQAPGTGWDALAVVHEDALTGQVHAQNLAGPLLEIGRLPYAAEVA
jgi:tRNA-modifying protein YgfZ